MSKGHSNHPDRVPSGQNRNHVYIKIKKIVLDYNPKHNIKVSESMLLKTNDWINKFIRK
jgi:hypothetical protein